MGIIGKGTSKFKVIDHFILTVDELETDRLIGSLDQHGPVVAVVAHLAAGHRAVEAIN